MTAPEPQDGRPLILYVDDEKANRVVFQQSLIGDFNIVTAVDGPNALEILEQREVAVVVTDMRMPAMDGEQLLRIVRERWPQTIRIVVTAYSDIDPILRAINEGLVARYLVKPWEFEELVQILRWATETWTLGKDSAAVYRRLLETERLVTLGSLSAMVVHDLKQPLMSMTANVEVLLELAEYAQAIAKGLGHVPANDRERVTELVESLPQITADVKSSVEHLSTLISGLRGFNKPATAARRSKTDPLPVLRQAISSCREIAARVHGHIELVAPEELPAVTVPQTELTQVLINLIANAAQAVTARPGEGGLITVTTEEPGEGQLSIAIRDNGVGMPPEVLSRLGTPFFTTREEGTGLGVANCQRLIGAAGGRMRIESTVGVGTTVTIVVPVAR